MKVKKVLAALALGVTLCGSVSGVVPNECAVVEAASAKNPTVKVKRLFCNGPESIVVEIEKGHSLKSVKIDGKEKKSSFSRCGAEEDKRKSYYDSSNTGYGTHKVEVRDNKGYWVITYVTVK